MGTLQIIVGDLHFSARWEPAAPRHGRGDPADAADRVEAHPLPLDAANRRGSRSATSGPGSTTRTTPRTRRPASSRSTRAGSASARSSSRTAAARRRRRSASWRPTTSRRSTPTTAGTTGCARWAGAACGRAPRRSRSARSRADARPRDDRPLIRGGTVVTRRPVVRAPTSAVERRRIIGDRDRTCPGSPTAAGEVVDATGLLVLPGVVDVHTHTRVATDDEPDRFFQDSVAAAFGGTTTFLAFNNPGTGSSPAAAALAPGRHRRVAAATDVRLARSTSALSLGDHRPAWTTRSPSCPRRSTRACRRPRRSWSSTSGSPTRALFEAMRVLRPSAGGMLQVHCEDPVLLDTAVAAALAARRDGTALPRDVATARTSRPWRPTGRSRSRARPTRRVHVVHLSCAAALRRRLGSCARPGLPVHAETCPHYLTLTDDRYAASRSRRGRASTCISPPLRAAGDPRRAVGGPGRRRARRWSRPTTSPDRLAVEKGEAARRVSFDRICNGAPGIETLLRWSTRGRRRRAGSAIERMVDVLSTTPGPAVRAACARAPSRSVATPTSCCSIRSRGGRSAPSTCITPATTRRTRASRSRGAVRSVVRPRPGGRPRRRLRRRPRLRPVRRARAWQPIALRSAAQSSERVRPQRQELGELVGQDEPVEQRDGLGQPALVAPASRASSSSRIAA